MTPAMPHQTIRPIGVVGRGPLARGILGELRDAEVELRSFDAPPTGTELEDLGCLVFADDDDASNVDVVLHTRQRKPSLPLVVRLFDPVLEEYLSSASPDIKVLSMSSVAVPTLSEVIGDAPMSTASVIARFRAFTGKLDRLLLVALGFVVSITFGGTAFFAKAMSLSLVDAFYFVITTMTTTGYGDISPKDHPSYVKIGAAALMVASATTFAIFFALVSDWVFARRLDVVLGRVPTRFANHVVLIGGGHMSARLASTLRSIGQRALIIEREADNPLLTVLRALGHHVLIGDATKEQTLQLAGAERARSILVLTSQDAHNLHIALIARSLSRGRVWARIDSPLLAQHITENSSILAGSPLHMAARAFAQEALALASRSPDSSGGALGRP